MLMIDLVKAIQARRSFLLLQGTLERVPEGYRVAIPRRSAVAVLPEERKAFENPRGKLWRVGAGGGLLVLHCTDVAVALMRYRDSGAPSYGDHWTLGSGLTASIEEVVHPLHVAVRECFEEFSIWTPSGVVIPRFGHDDLDRIARGAVRSGSFLRGKKEFETETYVSAEASFMPVDGEETLAVAFEGVEDETRAVGVIAVDPHTRGIDLLKVMSVKVPYRFDEIVVVDDAYDRHGKALDAPVGCMDITRLALGREFDAVFQHGKRQEPKGYVLERATPPLRALIYRKAP